jgi:hypothetical protein
VQEHEREQQAAAREVPGVREQEQSANTVSRAIARDMTGVQEHETEQRAAAREVPGVREHETELRAEDPAVQARESRQRAVARGKKTYAVACKCVNVAYGMNPVFTVVGTFIFRLQHLGLGRNVVLMASFLLPVRTLTKN